MNSLDKTQAITQIANDFDCSRNTVYKQQAKAKNAINQAFTANNDQVVFINS